MVGLLQYRAFQAEQAARIVVHPAIDGHCLLDPFISVPDAGVVAAQDEWRIAAVLPDDGIEQAATAKEVIVASQPMVLEKENPRCHGILSHKQLIVSRYAIGKEEGDGKVRCSSTVILVLVALHDEGEAIGLDIAVDKGHGVGPRSLQGGQRVLPAWQQVGSSPLDATCDVVAVDASRLRNVLLHLAACDQVVDIQKRVDAVRHVAHLHQCAVISAAGIVAHSRRHDVAESDLLAAEIVVNPRGDFLAILLEIGDDVGHK